MPRDSAGRTEGGFHGSPASMAGGRRPPSARGPGRQRCLKESVDRRENCALVGLTGRSAVRRGRLVAGGKRGRSRKPGRGRRRWGGGLGAHVGRRRGVSRTLQKRRAGPTLHSRAVDYWFRRRRCTSWWRPAAGQKAVVDVSSIVCPAWRPRARAAGRFARSLPSEGENLARARFMMVVCWNQHRFVAAAVACAAPRRHAPGGHTPGGAPAMSSPCSVLRVRAVLGARPAQRAQVLHGPEGKTGAPPGRRPSFAGGKVPRRSTLVGAEGHAARRHEATLESESTQKIKKTCRPYSFLCVDVAPPHGDAPRPAS